VTRLRDDRAHRAGGRGLLVANLLDNQPPLRSRSSRPRSNAIQVADGVRKRDERARPGDARRRRVAHRLRHDPLVKSSIDEVVKTLLEAVLSSSSS